ncbi:hypothetical protein CSA56_14520 [candidate division KSB3 bacterium]|uniref:Uncharacterized protein n=1 Tax=candidate division KSB3 bacterium TaxID=2044937 RepID=A0A2G6KD24_9BACT|nr:MAG: hypothetical protein CSA56_14520 [candidate division KSB3 bacterium]
MGCFKFFMIPLLIGATILATVVSFSKWGAADIEHPQGINLRGESVNYRSHGGFFAYYAMTRSHSRGGLLGGK